MKVYIKIIIIIVFATFSFVLSAKQVNPNIKFRKLVNVYSVNQTFAPTFDKGYKYDVVTTNVNYSTYNPYKKQLHNASTSHYYHSYGVRNMSNKVVYNSHYVVERHMEYNVVNQVPFEDVVVMSNQMRVSEGQLPDDPSVPIGDGVLPLFLFAMMMFVCKYKKN